MDRTFLHMPGSVLHRGVGGEGGTVFPPLGEIIVLEMIACCALVYLIWWSKAACRGHTSWPRYIKHADVQISV